MVYGYLETNPVYSQKRQNPTKDRIIHDSGFPTDMFLAMYFMSHKPKGQTINEMPSRINNFLTLYNDTLDCYFRVESDLFIPKHIGKFNIINELYDAGRHFVQLNGPSIFAASQKNELYFIGSKKCKEPLLHDTPILPAQDIFGNIMQLEDLQKAKQKMEEIDHELKNDKPNYDGSRARFICGVLEAIPQNLPMQIERVKAMNPTHHTIIDAMEYASQIHEFKLYLEQKHSERTIELLLKC